MYKKPEIDPRFFYGNIISYDFIGGITKDRDKFRIKLKLFYSSGKEYHYQKSGFLTKKEAEKAKNKIIHDLLEGTFCPFNFSFQEVLEYWLYIYCVEEKKYTVSTFESYRNIIYNHILSKINGCIKIRTIDSRRLERFLLSIDTFSLRKIADGVLQGVFRFAYAKHYIDFNPAPIASKKVRKLKPMSQTKRNVSWSIDQIKYALRMAKDNFPELYMPFLLSIMLGTRVSETIAMKYTDIDYRNKNVLITKQLGSFIDYEAGMTRKGEVQPKSINGIREIPIPQWVLDEIIVARAKYEKNRTRIPDFQDKDYICSRIDGRAYTRSSMNRDFKKLLKVCGYEDIHWHDLRHIFATCLENNDINIKSVSTFLGHGSIDMTQLYVAAKVEVYDCTKMSDVWTFVKPPELLHEDCINIHSDSFASLLPASYDE